jgi:NADPH-dependent curcumin reductase CurA
LQLSHEEKQEHGRLSSDDLGKKVAATKQGRARVKNRQIVLVARPKGKLGPEHFRMSEGAVPEPKEGEVLLRVHLISLDAANRAWMQGATYRSAVEAGSVMAGGAIAEVVTSRAPDFRPGDLVFADTGWQDYAALAAKALVKVPRIEPMTHLLRDRKSVV